MATKKLQILGNFGSGSAVLYTDQTLTEEQKAQARTNIGATSAEVFIAEYGVTSLAEMEEAYNAGRMLFCRDGTNYAPLYQKTLAGSFAFYSHTSTTQTNRYCTANEGWQRKDTGLCESKHNEFESQIGDIETALDELHTYAQALISGGGA